MQIATSRHLLLVAVLVVGAALYALVNESQGGGRPRWPTADVLFAVDGWTSGPLTIDQDSSQTEIVSRVFRNQRGTTARLSLVTSPAPKLYAAGGEVPYLGSGFAVETPSRELVPISGNLTALVARRGAEQWLVLYAYGEQRGLLGNGMIAWSLAVLDGLVGRPNDYYKMYLAVRADTLDAKVGGDVAALGETVFPRVANWYAAAS